MLFDFSSVAAQRADVVLFEDHAVTEHLLSRCCVVRPKRAEDGTFEHKAEPAGDYVLEFGGEAVATGGFMLHYNKPFADLYMGSGAAIAAGAGLAAFSSRK